MKCDFGMIEDGTSNTAAISEVEIGSAEDGTLIKGNVAFHMWNWGMTNWAAPGNCRQGALQGAMGANFRHEYRATTLTPPDNDRIIGSRWGGAHPIFSQFFMAAPPNSPSCAQNHDGGNENWGILVSASSHHTGGVNVAMCDGAVRFISDTVDAGDQMYDPWDKVLQRGGQWGDPPGVAPVGQGGDKSLYRSRVSEPSRYGIWGALGSKAGGEAKSL